MINQPRYIYALQDPDTNEYRYVGKTHSPKIRMAGHYTETRHMDNPCGRWIAELRASGKRPEMVILGVTTKQNASAAELRWIEYGLDNGWRLTNIKIGNNVMVEIEIDDDLKAWTMANGGSDLVRALLRDERARRN